MAKKKLTKEQIRAKARAYANKMTVGKMGDMYALVGPELNQVLVPADLNTRIKDMAKFKTGYDWESKEFNWEWLVHGWGGTANRAAEKAGFRFLGIKGPRSEIKTGGDVLDWLTYFGATGMAAYDNKGDMRTANIEAYRIQNGIDLRSGSAAAWDPADMFWHKEVPYIIQKKIRQIPFVKRTFAKINKLVM